MTTFRPRAAAPQLPDDNPVASAASALQALELQAETHEPRSFRLIDGIFRVVGSGPFLLLHFVWFAAWIALNVPGSPLAFDEFPFPVLVLAVSMEVIVLALLVLVAENRQTARDQARDRIHLELNLIAEREITKALQMLSEVHAALGISHGPDSELEAMHRPTQVEELADAATQEG